MSCVLGCAIADERCTGHSPHGPERSSEPPLPRRPRCRWERGTKARARRSFRLSERCDFACVVAAGKPSGPAQFPLPFAPDVSDSCRPFRAASLSSQGSDMGNRSAGNLTRWPTLAGSGSSNWVVEWARIFKCGPVMTSQSGAFSPLMQGRVIAHLPSICAGRGAPSAGSPGFRPCRGILPPAQFGRVTAEALARCFNEERRWPRSCRPGCSRPRRSGCKSPGRTLGRFAEASSYGSAPASRFGMLGI